VLDKDASIHVFCSHGMGEERTASFFLDNLLLQLEMEYRPLLGLRNSWIRKLLQLAGKNTEHYRPVISLRNTASRLWKRLTSKSNNKSRNDRPYRYFFELVNNQATGAVRFNIRGRERKGILHSKQLPKLCKRLDGNNKH